MRHCIVGYGRILSYMVIHNHMWYAFPSLVKIIPYINDCLPLGNLSGAVGLSEDNMLGISGRDACWWKMGLTS